MEEFNVNISVLDCCSTKCQSNSMSTTKIFTSTSDFIALFCNYYLKIVSVQENYVVISIDNGSIFYIRKSFVNIPIKICLSDGCVKHLLSIQINSIT